MDLKLCVANAYSNANALANFAICQSNALELALIKCLTCIGISIGFNFWIYMNLYIDCTLEARNYSMLSLAFIASSFRVTEENLLVCKLYSLDYPLSVE